MQKTSAYSEQFLRKRKMMLMVPLLIVPMACLAFYGLGGGKGGRGAKSAGTAQKGLNMTLPLAHIDARNQPTDKLGFYEKAKLDSLRLQERRKMDPYAVGNKNPLQPDSQADQVMQKLDQLKQVLGKTGPGLGQGVAGAGGRGTIEGYPAAQVGMASPDLDTSAVGRTQSRIRDMMERLKASNPGQRDPGMDKLDGMLDKLIRIQHPELVRGDSGRAQGAGTVALVNPLRVDVPVGTLSSGGDVNEDNGGFMEIGFRDDGDSVRDLAIEAIINSDQTLTAGSTVALRIVQDFTVGNEHIPANQLVYGLASLAGERLTVSITSIRVGQSIVPVSMLVYDLDGLPGIRVPGAISRDVSKESADQALSGLEMASADPSLGAQAASAGLEFAKSLASRKIRLVRVSLPAGYRVLLKNGKSNTH